MPRHSVSTCLGLIALLSLPATVVAQNRERQQIMADVRMLHEQTMRLQLLIAALTEQVQQLSERMDEQAVATVRGFADQQLQIENVAGDVRILREKLDDTNVRISSMSQELEALRASIPATPYPAAELATDPETGLPITPSPSHAPAAALVPGASPQRVYDTAWADYTSGQWDLAIEGFIAYLRMFPRSVLADDAQFYIGETYFAQDRFEDAIEAYERVLLNHPDGDVIPQASYKRGLALDNLGEAARARQAFELVVENYPESDMAILAQQSLDRLEQLER